jgi:hypothetical protein
MLTDAIKMSLDEFGPDRVWFTSIGIPGGLTVHFTGLIDEESGESYDLDPSDIRDCIPFDWSLEGTVTAGEWCWDGRGNPRDWNRNTITRIVAFRPES